MNMISIRKDGLIEYKDMTRAELNAFIYFLKHERLRHQQDIDKIDDSLKRMIKWKPIE